MTSDHRTKTCLKKYCLFQSGWTEIQFTDNTSKVFLNDNKNKTGTRYKIEKKRKKKIQ